MEDIIFAFGIFAVLPITISYVIVKLLRNWGEKIIEKYENNLEESDRLFSEMVIQDEQNEPLVQ